MPREDMFKRLIRLLQDQHRVSAAAGRGRRRTPERLMLMKWAHPWLRVQLVLRAIAEHDWPPDVRREIRADFTRARNQEKRLLAARDLWN
ncbi:MAG TPA: hypothetical protein VNN07_05640 [Candidatus Tectomicrobia bacterium]|nr:hypothetical protein [Candidatus Tectomicrobia bacterium]